MYLGEFDDSYEEGKPFLYLQRLITTKALTLHMTFGSNPFDII